MQSVMSTRGSFMVCDACYSLLKECDMLDGKHRTISDAVSDEFCMNCYDLNKVLIDDLAGSSE